MPELPSLRFIPFRRSDIVAMCLDQRVLKDQQKTAFSAAHTKIVEHFQEDFFKRKQELKDAYSPLDPDADTRSVTQFRDSNSTSQLSQMLEQVLNRANYESVSPAALQLAFDAASLFSLRLYVDLDDFAQVLLYTRGATKQQEEIPQFFGLFKRQIIFTNYDRVVVYIRFKDDVDTQSTLGGCQPGSTMLKLFQNVPAADLEMLFPNTRVGMRFTDKLMIGIPALISGGVVMTTKLGATIVLLGSLLGFWFGLSSEPVTLDRGGMLVLAAGLGALGGYFWKQYSSFKNRKMRFTQALTENLYFKLLDNNAGVLLRLLDEAEDSECKESLLAYYFLLVESDAISPQQLDANIESWFAETWQCRLDFEINDALQKLNLLGLATQADGKWSITTKL